MMMEPCRWKLCILLAVMFMLLSSAAAASGVHGPDRLAENSSKDDRIGADETAIRRSGGGHGHGRGHGRHGHGRGRGPPETPATTVFNPRTVTGGHHGQNAAAATNPGQPCAVGTCVLLGVAILLRRL